jgi:hypothetical protein
MPQELDLRANPKPIDIIQRVVRFDASPRDRDDARADLTAAQ